MRGRNILSVDVNTASAEAESFIFVDVREGYEFDAGHIAGSIHIPMMELPHRFDEIPRDRPIVAVCQIGQRSELAANFLTQQGFEAHNLEGGMAKWVAAGFPSQSGEGSEGRVVDGWARDFDGLLKDRTEPEAK